MEDTRVPYHIKINWYIVITGVMVVAYACYGIMNHITTRRYGLSFWWFIIACSIIVLLEGGRAYTLSERGISCYIFGIPVKKFHWEQVSHIVFFPQAGNARRSLDATLLIVTGSCPVYKKDRQNTNTFAWYELTHWRRIVRIILPDKKDQEILELVRELCKTPIETRERKPK